MRIYADSSEETLRTRKLLADWAGEGFLSKTQYEHLERETVSDLRTTNIFLRLVLFFFTLIVVGAATGLFFVGFFSRPSDEGMGFFLLIFSVACYTASEVSASRARLYRYGIEEALAACSVGFLCAGILLAFFSNHSYYSRPDAAQFVVPAVGAVSSLWIWRRFGLWYAFLAAMIFAVFLPGYWTSSRAAQHLAVAAFYAVGLVVIFSVRPRHRFDYLNDHYSLVEALLWLGIYLAINLKLVSLLPRTYWWAFDRSASEFPRPFYWTTWLLIWCLPAVALVRGIRQKDRFVIAVGAVVAILTFVSNKPYFGWTRHTWDAMILGALLTCVALFIRRWLAHGPKGIRAGFTAARLSAKDKNLLNVGSAVLGMAAGQSVGSSPHPKAGDFHFDGGASGGGGASGNY